MKTHPISYLDTLMKTERESIETTIRRMQILFAEFLVRMEDTRLPKIGNFGELVGGTCCVGGQGKEWIGYLMVDLRVFGMSLDQWTTAAQDEEEWCKTVGKGAGRFMTNWVAAEKARAGLRQAVVCPNVTRRTKGRISQSKRARAGSLAVVA